MPGGYEAVSIPGSHTMKQQRIRSGDRIKNDERLIVALDVPSVKEARELVLALGADVVFYKMGLELLMTGGYFELIAWLRAHGKKVFADVKFYDVPETVRAAVTRLGAHDVEFITVHGNDEILAAAVSAAQGVKVLAVTVLTSFDESDLEALGLRCSVDDLVLRRARNAMARGCAGVVASGLEAAMLRKALGAEGYHQCLVVTPGIRAMENERGDDQKRVVDVLRAFRNGADHIVVGRPIIKASDPKRAARAIQEQIEKAVE